MTSRNTTNAISSPVSADGRAPCALPDGMTPGQSGPAHVHASHLRLAASSAEQPMSATCGLSFTGSSASVALQQSLESKLQARLASAGLTALQKTLKPSATPSGRLFSKGHWSGRHISGTDFTLYPTPAAQTQQGGMRIDGGTRARKKWASRGGLPTGTAECLALTCWLMGYPAEWLRASLAALGTPSSPSLEPSS